MKYFLRIFLLCSLCCTTLLAYGNGVQPNYYRTRYAVQAGMSTGGNVALGTAIYARYFEIGIVASGLISKNHTKTETFVPGFFAGARMFVAKATVFGVGINLFTRIGKVADKKIQSSYGIGPYLSLQRILSDDVMLTVWYNPYLFIHEKIGNVTTRTHRIGAGGGIGLEYFFN